MKIYLVGGCVRDQFLRGETASDRDWVVIGSNHEEMIAKGFKQVGASFPVYLHPVTKEEYALARQERKTTQGYHGFSVESGPHISLEDDLKRRDLTINAIAYDPEKQELIDPFHGVDDWNHNLLRHVSDAFEEDPLRLVRLARFYARFEQMSIAPETFAKCLEIVKSQELSVLPSERVSLEIRKMFETAEVPMRFWMFLKETGAIEQLVPEYADIQEYPVAWNRSFKKFQHPFLKGVFEMIRNLDEPKKVIQRLMCSHHESNILNIAYWLDHHQIETPAEIWEFIMYSRALHHSEFLVEAWDVLEWPRSRLEFFLNLLHELKKNKIQNLEFIDPAKRSEAIRSHSLEVIREYGLR